MKNFQSPWADGVFCFGPEKDIVIEEDIAIILVSSSLQWLKQVGNMRTCRGFAAYVIVIACQKSADKSANESANESAHVYADKWANGFADGLRL